MHKYYEHMPRIKCKRFIENRATSNYYKPAGTPFCQLSEVTLELDEFEAIRLADLEGMYQDEAAEKMQISRQTFGRIINSAHQKIAEALVMGKAIKINNNQ